MRFYDGVNIDKEAITVILMNHGCVGIEVSDNLCDTPDGPEVQFEGIVDGNRQYEALVVIMPDDTIRFDDFQFIWSNFIVK